MFTLYWQLALLLILDYHSTDLYYFVVAVAATPAELNFFVTYIQAIAWHTIDRRVSLLMRKIGTRYIHVLNRKSPLFHFDVAIYTKNMCGHYTEVIINMATLLQSRIIEIPL